MSTELKKARVREVDLTSRLDRAHAEISEAALQERERAAMREVALEGQAGCLRERVKRLEVEVESARLEGKVMRARMESEVERASSERLGGMVTRCEQGLNKLGDELRHARAEAGATLEQARIAHQSTVELITAQKQREVEECEARLEGLERRHEHVKQLLREQSAAIRAERKVRSLSLFALPPFPLPPAT